MDYVLPQQKQKVIERTFILGAGFSRAIRGIESPLRKELFEKLSIPFDIRDKYHTDDIEMFMTDLDRDIKRYKDDNSPEAGSYMELKIKIKNQVVQIFRNLADPNKYNNDVATKFGELLKENDIIITFNYDTFLEQFLCEIHKIWSPFGGYTPIVTCELPANHVPKNDEMKNIIILKPHGSINFLEAQVIGTEDDIWIGLEITEDIFPSLHCNFNYGLGRGQPALILPTYLQQEFPRQLNALWHLASEFVKKAQKIVIIGYSLPEEDGKTNDLFSYIEPHPDIETREVLIINGKEESSITKVRIEKLAWFNPRSKKISVKPLGYLEEEIDKLPEILSGRRPKGEKKAVINMSRC